MDSADSRSPETPQATLQREVIVPMRESSGVGVMLVASAAMFFAVASSAFILRVQMPVADQCHRFGSLVPTDAEANTNMEAVEVELINIDTIIAGEPTHCGGGSFAQESGDGPTSIVFRLCKAP